jgi:hypothetical protein
MNHPVGLILTPYHREESRIENQGTMRCLLKRPLTDLLFPQMEKTMQMFYPRMAVGNRWPLFLDPSNSHTKLVSLPCKFMGSNDFRFTNYYKQRGRVMTWKLQQVSRILRDKYVCPGDLRGQEPLLEES